MWLPDGMPLAEIQTEWSGSRAPVLSHGPSCVTAVLLPVLWVSMTEVKGPPESHASYVLAQWGQCHLIQVAEPPGL